MNSSVNISEQESKATSVFRAVEILLGATLPVILMLCFLHFLETCLHVLFSVRNHIFEHRQISQS